MRKRDKEKEEGNRNRRKKVVEKKICVSYLEHKEKRKRRENWNERKMKTHLVITLVKGKIIKRKNVYTIIGKNEAKKKRKREKWNKCLLITLKWKEKTKKKCVSEVINFTRRKERAKNEKIEVKIGAGKKILRCIIYLFMRGKEEVTKIKEKKKRKGRIYVCIITVKRKGLK